MLNKALFLFTLIFSFNAIAENKITNNDISIIAKQANIREPFTALATADIIIENNSNEDIEILKITSANARHVDIFSSFTNDFGAIQRKKEKTIIIKANSKLSFSNKDKYQVMLTGLNRKYDIDEEIALSIKFKDLPKYNIYLTVHANYN